MKSPTVGMLVLVIVLGFTPAWAQEGQDVRTQSLEQVKEGVDLARRGKLDEAIQATVKAVETDPTNVAAHSHLGYLLLDKNDNDAAMKSFEEALKLQPSSHTAKTGKGIVLARRGELDAAEALLTEALSLNPDPLRTHYELGLLYEKKGDLGKAIAEYKKAIEKYRQGRK